MKSGYSSSRYEEPRIRVRWVRVEINMENKQKNKQSDTPTRVSWIPRGSGSTGRSLHCCTLTPPSDGDTETRTTVTSIKSTVLRKWFLKKWFIMSYRLQVWVTTFSKTWVIRASLSYDVFKNMSYTRKSELRRFQTNELYVQVWVTTFSNIWVIRASHDCDLICPGCASFTWSRDPKQ